MARGHGGKKRKTPGGDPPDIGTGAVAAAVEIKPTRPVLVANQREA